MRTNSLQRASEAAFVVFDLDGTILQLSEIENDAYIEALQDAVGGQINSDWFSYALRTDIGVAKEALCSKYGDGGLEFRVSAFIKDYTERLEKIICSPDFEPSFVDGALEVLQMLAGKDHITIGLATANIRVAAEKRLIRAKIFHYFHACSYADYGRTKTEILEFTIVKARAKTQSVVPSRTVFIGDQVPDVIAATACGIEFFGIAKNNEQAENLRAAGCTKVARNLCLDGQFGAFLSECSIVV